MSRVQRAGPDVRVSCAVADLISGVGLTEAVADIDVIVHAASNSRNAGAVDVEGTQRLIDVARTAGVEHLLYVSIVGVDRIPYAYYQRKLAVERMIAESGVPFSILRATQFHSFVDFLLGEAVKYPFNIMPIPSGFFVQSVAVEEVAARVCRAVDDGPNGRLGDFGGPEVLPVEEVTTAWLDRNQLRWAGVWAIPIYLSTVTEGPHAPQAAKAAKAKGTKQARRMRQARKQYSGRRLHRFRRRQFFFR